MIGLVELLRSDTRNFIWSPHVQAELFGAIRKLWPVLNEESREVVCNMILEGPPRGLRFPDDSESEWAHFVNRRIWERLTRIEKVAPGLSGPAAERLREIERENPEWRLQESDRENVQFIGKPYMGASPEAHGVADKWLVLPIPEIAERIRSGIRQTEDRIYPGYFPNEVWLSITEKNQAKVLKILQYFLEEGFYHEDTWVRGLWTFSKASMQDENSGEFLNLIGDLSPGFLEKTEIISAVTSILNSMAKSFGENEKESNVKNFLDFWDRLFPYAIKESRSGIGEDSPNGILGYAINHPAGNITGMLFDIFPAGNSPRGSGVHPDMKKRLEKILQSYDTGALGWRASYAIIASRLAWLHFLDPKWTEKEVLLAFDWSNEKKAKISWGAYLFSPRIDTSLWEAIKGDFVLALERHGNLPRNSYRLFASIAIGWPGAISHEDTRRCVRAMDEFGRREVLNYFSSSLEGSEMRSSVMWKEKIKPWINAVWPRDVKLRSQDESLEFTMVAISAGDSFSDAVDTLYEFLEPTEDHMHSILYKIKSNADSGKLALDRDAGALLKFMDKIIPETVEYYIKEDIKALLNQMKEADSAIERDRRYCRLEELTM